MLNQRKRNMHANIDKGTSGFQNAGNNLKKLLVEILAKSAINCLVKEKDTCIHI